ncbi:PP2C family protein-serine/threonine phosphatase [Streptomyces sp. ME02-8801-2C]|uniref:PP2C family protein-serine/threonine phosphatase n=1 Tax=Streptomyces sp. ME02-8801-2C TaxID=3028680 RepID=UPI0029B6EAD4|nr:PP2C family protein-serine/threonine phosphatase [Streptomyces sp. ME02-8801-2C]MDX3454015.1 PP2C family protein-serine/threonine phosphatase [Streptomyces sp. ME02-8801-2C]
MGPEDPVGTGEGPALSSPAFSSSAFAFAGRGVGWVPPLVLLVGIAVLDWNTTGEFRIISWIVLVPGIAAALCGVAGTVAFAVLSLCTYVFVDGAWPHQYQTGLPDFILVALGGVLAVLACAVRLRGERRMLHMRDVAETTRRTVLRPLPPGWGGLDHAAVYLAADAVARVGGDFYDIQPGPYGTRVLLGDVQGKGLGAVEAAAAMLGTFREAGYHEPALATVAERLEVRMLRHVRYRAAVGRDEGDRFATAVLIGFPEGRDADVSGRVVEVVNFGHEPSLIVSSDGVRSLPPGDGLPLGLSELSPGGGGRPSVVRVPLADRETLLLVTDGVTEARDSDGAFFPLRERVAEAVAADPRVAEPRRLVAFVRDGTLRHCGGRLGDDTTVFAVRVSGPGGG